MLACWQRIPFQTKPSYSRSAKWKLLVPTCWSCSTPGVFDCRRRRYHPCPNGILAHLQLYFPFLINIRSINRTTTTIRAMVRREVRNSAKCFVSGSSGYSDDLHSSRESVSSCAAEFQDNSSAPSASTSLLRPAGPHGLEQFIACKEHWFIAPVGRSPPSA